MQETLALLKFAIENSTPIIFITCIIIFLGYKAKAILYGFLEFKDLTKKRLIQKHEETIQFDDKNYLSSNLLADYKRLCEETQIKALIGCGFCSKEMAAYILSRADISNATKTYHRVKGHVEINGVDVVTINRMKHWRIKLNEYVGIFFYFVIFIFAFLPLLIPAFAKLANTPLKIQYGWSFVLPVIGYTICMFIISLLILNESLKPKFAKIFCDLKAKNPNP